MGTTEIQELTRKVKGRKTENAALGSENVNPVAIRAPNATLLAKRGTTHSTKTYL